MIDTDVPAVKCLQNKKWKKIDDRQKMPLPCQGVTGHLKKKFENSTKMESKDFLYVSYLKKQAMRTIRKLLQCACLSFKLFSKIGNLSEGGKDGGVVP